VFSKAFPKKFIEPILEPHLFPMDMYNLYNLMTRRATHDTRTDRSRIVFDTNISSIFYGNKLIYAIRGTDRLSAADDASNILEYSALESDISDRVTVTDDITH
jgi:hypothetical protein